MLFVKKIRRILKLGIVSAYLKNAKPISILLLADPECGKTSLLYSFDFGKKSGVLKITKPTMSAIEKHFKDILEGSINYIIIPDLIRITEANRATAKNITGFFNSAIEEGLTEITTYNNGTPDTKFLKKPWIIGVATALTRSKLQDRRGNWNKIGFFSRFLPVSYSYTKAQQEIIRDEIYKGQTFDGKEKLKLGSKKAIICNPKFPRQFNEHIKKLAEKEELYGFRYANQFRTLLMANAFLRNSNKVTQRDVEAIKDLWIYINTDYNDAE